MPLTRAQITKRSRDREKVLIAAVDELLEVIDEGLDLAHFWHVLDGMPMERTEQIKFVTEKVRGKRVCLFERSNKPKSVVE